jgi:hypothetical protein
MRCAAIDALREPVAAREARGRRADDGQLDAQSSTRGVKETDDEAACSSCRAMTRRL